MLQPYYKTNKTIQHNTTNSIQEPIHKE